MTGEGFDKGLEEGIKSGIFGAGRGGPPRKPQLGRGPVALAMGEPEEVPGSGVKGWPPSPPTRSEVEGEFP